MAQQHTYKTLERLCTAIAERLLEDYDLHAVWVKAAKPEPPLPLVVSEVSVEVWREAVRLAAVRGGGCGLSEEGGCGFCTDTVGFLTSHV